MTTTNYVDPYPAFYSTNLMTKLRWLRDNIGENVRIGDLADAVSDGCGGCEQVRYGNDSDGVLVSVLWSPGIPGRDWTTYVIAEFSDDKLTNVYVRAFRTSTRWAEDSWEQYADCIAWHEEMPWEDVAEYIGESTDDDDNE